MNVQCAHHSTFVVAVKFAENVVTPAHQYPADLYWRSLNASIGSGSTPLTSTKQEQPNQVYCASSRRSGKRIASGVAASSLRYQHLASPTPCNAAIDHARRLQWRTANAARATVDAQTD